VRPTKIKPYLWHLKLFSARNLQRSLFLWQPLVHRL